MQPSKLPCTRKYYRKQYTSKKVMLMTLINLSFVNFAPNTFWLCILYGTKVCIDPFIYSTFVWYRAAAAVAVAAAAVADDDENDDDFYAFFSWMKLLMLLNKNFWMRNKFQKSLKKNLKLIWCPLNIGKILLESIRYFYSINFQVFGSSAPA